MKKFTSLIMALVLLLSCFTLAASAAGSSMDTATAINFGTSYNGQIAENDTSDYYKITLPSSGKITVSFSGSLERIKFFLYDASGGVIDDFTKSKNSNSDILAFDTSYDLTAGEYYVAFYGGYISGVYGYGNYSFSVGYVDAKESFSETQESKNNSFERSNAIEFGTSYNGQIAENDTSDYYKITLPSSGEITVSFSGSLERIKFFLYDASGGVIDDFTKSKNSNSDILAFDTSYDLTAGEYYVAFYGGYISGVYGYGNYSFSVGYVDAKESFSETQESKNNSFERSNAIEFGTSYNGQIAENDTSDYYKITLPSSGEITVSFSGSLERIKFFLYDASGGVIDDFTKSKNSNSDIIAFNTSYNLTAGEYYVAFYGGYISGVYGYGNYSFSITSGSTPTTQAPTQAPNNNYPNNDTPDNGGEEPNVTNPPADYIKPGDEGYIIPDTDSDVNIEINIYLNFEYTVINNYVVIINYIGDETHVTVPDHIDGYEVVGIGDNAFSGKGIETVEIPSTVTQFGTNAFGEESGEDIELSCDEGSAAHTYAKKKGISYNTEGSPAKSGSGIDVRTVVIIVVVLAAVAGVVAVILIGKKKSAV